VILVSEALSKELEKTAVRLKQVEEKQRETSEKVSRFLAEARDLATSIRSQESSLKISKQRSKVLAGFEEVMQAIGGMEHEKSHLLESFGKLLRQTETKPQKSTC